MISIQVQYTGIIVVQYRDERRSSFDQMFMRMQLGGSRRRLVDRIVQTRQLRYLVYRIL